MGDKKHRLTYSEVNNRDISQYLSSLGYLPVRTRSVNQWYLSPLRKEKTTSFKVNQRINRWYDHGIGKGGNLIDFGILYHQCSVTQLLKILSGDFSFQPQKKTATFRDDPEQKIIIVREEELSAPALLQYLENREVTIDIARKYCKEIYYTVGHRSYYAIGLKNDSGGYELRNVYFKGSSSPKDITTIAKGAPNVIVFEGMFDFLSYESRFWYVNGCNSDYVILNSIYLFERARPFIEQYDIKALHLDRDKAGQNCTACAMALNNGYHDCSDLYKSYKDVNEWLVNNGKRNQPDFLNGED